MTAGASKPLSGIAMPPGIVWPSHYKSGPSASGLVTVDRLGSEMALFATDNLGDAATGLDVVIAPQQNPDGSAALLLDAIVRVYAEVNGSAYLIPESVRSITDPTTNTRIARIRNRVSRRFFGTIQARVLPALGQQIRAKVSVRYAVIGREPHPDEDRQQVTAWSLPVSGNTGVLLSGAGACLQSYAVNAGAALTWLMLFKSKAYPPAAPIAGDPFFAVMPIPGSGGWESMNFVRGGQAFLNGVTFGCSTGPAAYVVDGAASVTAFAEGDAP